jgi:hypothetical protein
MSSVGLSEVTDDVDVCSSFLKPSLLINVGSDSLGSGPSDSLPTSDTALLGSDHDLARKTLPSNYEGKIFRPVNKADRVAGEAIADEKAIWQVVVHYAQATSLGKLAPHDLRRTCAKL